jgi:zinc/manganese transport system substrate-binding protein
MAAASSPRPNHVRAPGAVLRARRAPLVSAIALLAIALAGCGASAGGGSGGGIHIVATTTQLGDFVRDVGGRDVSVTQILQPNTDPHEYEPRPSDVEGTAGAKVVFESGDNLDAWMAKVAAQAGGHPTVVDVGATVPVKLPGESSGAEASRYDPHWWHDPVNAEVAIATIRGALIRADPAHRAAYRRNAAGYLAKLSRLDGGIRACVAGVPRPQRKLVTNHDAFGYFARRYGIKVVGAIIPSQTTQAQTSAGEVASLEALIRREGVKAVFPESSINPKLARAIADATGASAAYTLYGDTLGPKGSPGATYLTMEQANADEMVHGFTDGSKGCPIDTR